MKRIRWFSVAELNRSALASIAKNMLASPFTEASKKGFKLTNVRPNSIEGSFIQKQEVINSVVDPFGKNLRFQRVVFKDVHFTLSLKGPYLEVYDCPRGLSSFLGQLSKASGRSIAIAPPTISTVDWIREISVYHPNLKVISMLVGGVSLSNVTSAKCLIRGSEDIREHVKSLVGKGSYTIERAELKWLNGNETCCLDIRSGGRVTMIEGDDTSMLRVLRQTLFLHSESSDKGA